MASRIRVIGLKEFQRDYQKEIEQLLNRTFMLELANQARKLIYARTKQGFGSFDGTKFKLAPLKPSYIKVRSKLADAGRLGRFAELGTSPASSNLTLSGQMLEAITVSEVASRRFTLTVNDNQRDDGETNQQIAQYVTLGGRPFFELTSSEQLVLFKEIERAVRRAVRRLNQKK